MTAPRRHRPRHRRPSLHLSFDDEPFGLWLPDPADRLTVPDFGAASTFAMAVADLAVSREALVLLDDDRQVTAMLVDPPPPVGVGIGWCDCPGLEVPFSATLLVDVVDRVATVEPGEREVRAYWSLRRVHALQGLELLDVVSTDGDRVRSTAISVDPDCRWFQRPAA